MMTSEDVELLLAGLEVESLGELKRLVDIGRAEVRRDARKADVRTRLLARELDEPAGPLGDPKPGDRVYEAMLDGGDPPAESLYARLWLRVHELEDHAGAECDCPKDDA